MSYLNDTNRNISSLSSLRSGEATEAKQSEAEVSLVIHTPIRHCERMKLAWQNKRSAVSLVIHAQSSLRAFGIIGIPNAWQSKNGAEVFFSNPHKNIDCHANANAFARNDDVVDCFVVAKATASQ